MKLRAPARQRLALAAIAAGASLVIGGIGITLSVLIGVTGALIVGAVVAGAALFAGGMMTLEVRR